MMNDNACDCALHQPGGAARTATTATLSSLFPQGALFVSGGKPVHSLGGGNASSSCQGGEPIVVPFSQFCPTQALSALAQQCEAKAKIKGLAASHEPMQLSVLKLCKAQMQRRCHLGAGCRNIHLCVTVLFGTPVAATTGTHAAQSQPQSAVILPPLRPAPSSVANRPVPMLPSACSSALPSIGVPLVPVHQGPLPSVQSPLSSARTGKRADHCPLPVVAAAVKDSAEELLSQIPRPPSGSSGAPERSSTSSSACLKSFARRWHIPAPPSSSGDKTTGGLAAMRRVKTDSSTCSASCVHASTGSSLDAEAIRECLADVLTVAADSASQTEEAAEAAVAPPPPPTGRRASNAFRRTAALSRQGQGFYTVASQ